MNSRSALSIGVLVILAAASGCRTAVPIHVWQPPVVESTVRKRVVVSNVVGPKSITEPLMERLLKDAPKDIGRNTTVSHSLNLAQNEAIRLVSATDHDVSDIALSAAARSEGFDYVLRGEVLEDRRPKAVQEAEKRLAISWRLLGISDDTGTGGMPIVVDKAIAIERYPDLQWIQDEDQLLMTAAVRDTYRLIAPSVYREEVRLAVPYGLPGSRAVRKGNVAAVKGNWADAKRIWNDAAETHFWQPAAVHNLAMAAVAEQDFSAARKLISKAVRLQPSALHKSTRAWIEIKQREYHRAFQLPDPAEGWGVTQAQALQ